MCKIILCLLFVNGFAFAGFEQTDVGTRAKGMGGASISLTGDVWVMLYNPGALSELRRQEISFLYIPAQFGLKELSSSAASVGWPTSIGAFGLAVRSYGFELYKEFSGTVSYATKIAEIGAGINFNYHSVSIKNYGSAGTLGIDLGFFVQLNDEVRLGSSIKNINAPTIGVAREKLPQSFSFGAGYIPVSNLIIAFDYKKEIGFPSSPKFGVEYRIVDAVAFRCGMSDEPVQFSGGIGLEFSIFKIDYAYSSHEELGPTHSGSVSIVWGGSHE